MKPGAYLHWTLPRSLRSALEGQSSVYPNIPNRWLVIRTTNDGTTIQKKGWIVESDCPYDNDNSISTGSTLFLIDQNVVDAWSKSTQANRKNIKPEPIDSKLNTKSYTCSLGMSFNQTSWKEEAPDTSFLTAVAPGNIEFSAYIPHNSGMLSFYDDLSDAPGQCKISYLVSGWYSDLNDDIISVGPNSFFGLNTIEEVLQQLNWTIADNQEAVPIQASYYTGRSFGISWDKEATSAPVPDQLVKVRETKNMTVSIGNTSIDAFSTLVGQQLESVLGYKDPSQIIELLRAFNYDVLNDLNDVNGALIVDQKTRQRWFKAKGGGTKWIIRAEKSTDQNGNKKSNPIINKHDEAWLVQLNQDQKALDEALETLYDLQWELNAIWWKNGYMNASSQQMTPNGTGIVAKDLEPFLDPTNPHSAPAKVMEQLQIVNQYLTKVPRPIYKEGENRQEAFRNGILNFQTEKGIDKGKILKSTAQSRYWVPVNPNIFISGVEPDIITNPNNALVVRLSSQIISGLTLKNHKADGFTTRPFFPAFHNETAFESLIPSIYLEFLLLDPTNATQISKGCNIPLEELSSFMKMQTPITNYTGFLPTNSQALWTQKWNPMYMEWELMFTQIPFEFSGQGSSETHKNWFFDGTDYKLSSAVKGDSQTISISGRSLLSSHTQFTFADRLRNFLLHFGENRNDLKMIYDQIVNKDNWAFLCQELTGLNDWISQRNHLAFRRPTTETFFYKKQTIPYASAIGFDAEGIHSGIPQSNQGLVNSLPAVKYGGPTDYPFHGIRSGQCYLSHVILYDKYGRELKLIEPGGSGPLDADNFPLIVDKDLIVNQKIEVDKNIDAPFQLTPRICQPSRLDMLMVDQIDSSKVLGYAENVNPVCGWIIANHLDKALQIFATSGKNMGELALRYNTQDQTSVNWLAPPHSATTTIEDIKNISPQLYQFATSLKGKSAEEFHAFLETIDSTLWTTKPLGKRTDQNMSVLVGRPLALLRTQLKFTLNGAPYKSHDWPMPVKPAATIEGVPDFTSCQFSIRFGDLEMRNDGVIGYFENENYEQFNSAATPGTGQSFVREIGPLGNENGNYINLSFDKNSSEFITLIVDPRAAIHATTGILPIKKMTIPSEFVDGPLSNLEVTFKVGPLLSKINPSKPINNQKPIYPKTIVFPKPAERNGSWSWWEKELSGASSGQASSENWKGFELFDANTVAQLDNTGSSLHDGFLQFVSNLNVTTE